MWDTHISIAEDLTIQRDALIEEIQCLKQQQRTEAERWQAESRKREAEIEERLLRERREEIEKGKVLLIVNK